MKPSFDIRSDELKRLSVQFEKISRKVNDAAHDGLNKAAMRIGAQAQENLKNNNSYATGQLLSSLRIEDSRRTSTVDVIFNSDHALFVEMGRQPGKQPPMDKIFEWVKKRGIADTWSVKTQRRASRGDDFFARARSVAFLIARKIGRVGTKAQPFLYPAFRKNEQEVIEILQREINKVTR